LPKSQSPIKDGTVHLVKLSIFDQNRQMTTATIL